MDNIIDVFIKNDRNLRATARELKMSEQKARKLLISNGAYQTDRSKRILNLYYAGMTIDAISKLLELSHKTIQSYLPYRRCTYKQNQTKNAIKIQKWRQRKRENNKESIDV